MKYNLGLGLGLGIWRGKIRLPWLKTIRAHMGFGKFWKVMEIDKVIFQDLESIGQGTFLKIAMENFWSFVCENSTKWI